MSLDDRTEPPQDARLDPARRRRRRSFGWIAGGLAILIACGYVAACALTPAPAPSLALHDDASRSIAADDAGARAAIDAERAPTAVGWIGADEVWSNSEAAAPIASLSKLVTVLVVLDQEPLSPGASGTVHTWTAADAERQQQYLAQDGVAFPIPVGTEVTTRQMLELALIPSANDFASALARSTFGDDATFLAAVRDWQDRKGLASLTLFEPTGMDERNAASPADVLRIARLAIAHPVVAEIVAERTAELPWGIGTVTNTNPLFGVLDGVVGVKTGRTSVAGYNLAAARTSDALGREVVQLAVVLGRDTAADRLASSLRVFSALDRAPTPVTLVDAGEQVGTATTVDGAEVPLVATRGVSAVLVPGESAARTAELDAEFAETWAAAGAGAGADQRADSGRVPAGLRVGELRTDARGSGSEAGPGSEAGSGSEAASGAGSGADSIPIVTGADIAQPGLGWRLAHPLELFGWR